MYVLILIFIYTVKRNPSSNKTEDAMACGEAPWTCISYTAGTYDDLGQPGHSQYACLSELVPVPKIRHNEAQPVMQMQGVFPSASMERSAA